MKRAASLILGAAVALAGLALLSQRRPAWPDLPPWLDGPLTVSAVEQTVLFALWVAACALAIGLLRSTASNALRGGPKGRRRGLDLRRDGSRRDRRRSGQVMSQPEPTYTVAPPPAPHASTDRTPTVGDAVEAPARPPSSAATNDAAANTQTYDAAARVGIALLGPVSIEGADQPRRAATKELIAYLALNGEATRDQLLEALWPGQDPRRTRARLWQSVSEAGRLLGDAFVRKRDHYRLDHLHVRIDTAEFDRLLATADSADNPSAELAALEAALALWRGDPLAGADYHWATGTIRHLQATQLDLLERLARARLDAGDAPAALEAAERGIASEQLHEGLWRIALQAESELGRRDAINQRYEALRQLLDQRLGLQPDRATVTLYRQLLGQG